MEKNRKLDQEKLKDILDGHELWAESEGQVGTRADLGLADLSRAELENANLFRADLTGACLQGAALEGADLKEAELSGADLAGARLANADLGLADLAGADLQGADLRGAVLNGADMDSADLQGARLDNRAQLADAAHLLDCGGLFFEQDELDSEKASRKKRAEAIFGAGGNSEIGFALPAHLPPWRIAKVLDSLSRMAEGVRLSLVADFSSPSELAAKAADPVLWASEDEDGAARLCAISLRNPIQGCLEIRRGLGEMILALAVEQDPAKARAIAAKLDRADERLALAGDIARRGLDRLKSLLGGEDASLAINGVDVPLQALEAAA